MAARRSFFFTTVASNATDQLFSSGRHRLRSESRVFPSKALQLPTAGLCCRWAAHSRSGISAVFIFCPGLIAEPRP